MTKSLQSGDLLIILVAIVLAMGCGAQEDRFLDHKKLANEYFGEDAQWYLDNIPFFECSDKAIEQVYYYRWKLYKAHIRNVGLNDYVITEFIDHVAWDREPYCTINAASMHHIYEGRWLKDPRFMSGYISYLNGNGGNNRRYSESIGDATYANYLVTADSSFVVKQLDSLKDDYNRWMDHYDASKALYFIPAMPDATEYTIASIDGSGGKAGFDGGDAFRPTINSYMYANAMAVSRIAGIKRDDKTRDDYLKRAQALKENVEKNLWNDSLQHFTDRFKMNNRYVHYWDFIRARELAGLVPWYFNLPADTPEFTNAWKHITDTTHLLGKFGFRTNEPSYEYYFKQFVFFQGQRGSQWNGPSWPYQTSQVLTAMANVLHDYHQSVITTSDYLHSLRLYTNQHYLPDGNINLVENYDPNLGGPIVYYYWSNHYNHSSYNNLIITGLCGIRPDAGNILTINPLVDNSIDFFFLDDVVYHGHRLRLVYDRDGKKYELGKGLTVFVDGKKTDVLQRDGKFTIDIGSPLPVRTEEQTLNHALNISRKNGPSPSASINSLPDSLFQAIDGRIWYFPEVRNRWSSIGSTQTEDWYAVDFKQPKELSIMKIYPFADGKVYAAPDSITIEYRKDGGWLPVKILEAIPGQPAANTVNTLIFDGVVTPAVRVKFRHRTKQVAISELEFF